MPSTKPDQVGTGVSNVNDPQAVEGELVEEERMLREQAKKLIEAREKLATKNKLLREAMASRMRLPEDRAPTEEETAASDSNLLPPPW